MADTATIATQGHFGTVNDRLIAIMTQGHFDTFYIDPDYSDFLSSTLDDKYEAQTLEDKYQARDLMRSIHQKLLAIGTGQERWMINTR